MSQFIVSARKYRPQKFDEVIGQQHVAATLKNALAKNQLAHAFLFCGPRGVGKTTCARILAKVLNCQNLQNGADPCNECSSCQAFNDNASFNILELDAASNNSVEHIRTLIEQVRFQPQQGKYKIFIIDEVHMLSQQAFNAFLKTLEEPPPYAIFILATTEKHKIIPTILSRCQIFDFKRIEVDHIVGQLQHIAQAEGTKADTEALHVIAQKADGAMRDALSIYDKIASSTAEDITYKDVVENLNILDYDYFFKIVNSILQEDLPSILVLFSQIIRQGFDPEQVVLGLAEHMRELLMAKNPKTLQLLQVSDQLQKRYLDQSVLCSQNLIVNSLNILNQADINLLRSKNKRLHTEIALTKLCYLSHAFLPSSTQEKKTLDLSANNKKASPNPPSNPVKKEEVAPQTIRSADEVQEETPVSTMPKPDSPLPDESVAQHSPSSKTKDKKEKSFLITPSFNIGSISQAIRKEEELKKESKSEASLAGIQSLLNDYIEKEESNATKTALKNTDLELKPTGLYIYVPNTLVKDMVQQEAPLLQLFRDSFDFEGKDVRVIIDADKFPDQEKFTPKKILTNKDKYEMMATENANLIKLKNALNLKSDNE